MTFDNTASEALFDLFATSGISHSERLLKAQELVAQGADTNWAHPQVHFNAFSLYVGDQARTWAANIKEGNGDLNDNISIEQYEETISFFKHSGVNLAQESLEHRNVFGHALAFNIEPHMKALLHLGVELTEDATQKHRLNYYLLAACPRAGELISNFAPLCTLLRIKPPSPELARNLSFLINDTRYHTVAHHNECKTILKSLLEKHYLNEQLSTVHQTKELAQHFPYGMSEKKHNKI